MPTSHKRHLDPGLCSHRGLRALSTAQSCKAGQEGHRLADFWAFPLRGCSHPCSHLPPSPLRPLPPEPEQAEKPVAWEVT